MTFGGGPRTPRKPTAPPRLVDIESGSVMEKERRKLARGRSNTLRSRGLLFDALIQSPAAGGLVDTLGG